MIPIRFFVEGKGDKKFLSDVVEVNFGHKLLDENFIVTEGYNENWIGINSPTIRKSLIQGLAPVIIIDADSDFELRQNEIKEAAKQNKLDFSFFLFPNNRDKGNLENLLLALTISKHKKILDCFDGYRQCLSPYQVPDDKAKIFAYLEAIYDNDSKKAKEDNRDYKDKNAWSMDSKELENLVTFLKGVIAQ